MKTIFRTLMLTSAVIMAAGCGSNTSKTASAPVAEVEVADPTVSVVEVFTQDVPQEAVYTSTVQAFVKNNIVPQAGNRIKKINVEVGDFVKARRKAAKMLFSLCFCNDKHRKMWHIRIPPTRRKHLFTMIGIG